MSLRLNDTTHPVQKVAGYKVGTSVVIPVTHDDSEVFVPRDIRSLVGLIRHNNKRSSQAINILAFIVTLLLTRSIVRFPFHVPGYVHTHMDPISSPLVINRDFIDKCLPWRNRTLGDCSGAIVVIATIEIIAMGVKSGPHRFKAVKRMNGESIALVYNDRWWSIRHKHFNSVELQRLKKHSRPSTVNTNGLSFVMKLVRVGCGIGNIPIQVMNSCHGHRCSCC